MPSARRFRPLRAVAAVVMALTLVAAAAGDAEARRGGSFGSRGLRTYDAPAPTRTAPQPAAPLERSATPATRPGATQATPAAAPAGRGMFGRGGFGTGFLGGLLGAGLIGMLLGGGFFSGLGNLAGLLGFALQALLIVFLVRLAFRFFQNRNQPAYAGAAPAQRTAPDPGPGFNGGAGAAPDRGDEAGAIADADYDAFEQLLQEVQTAHSREDLNALRRLATPEMVSYFADELADNASRGVVNQVSGVELLQGDLSEAWREGDTEYATVAMRYALADAMVNRETGAVVEGDPDHPVEVTELWTFRRAAGGAWLLSAIQQAGGGR